MKLQRVAEMTTPFHFERVTKSNVISSIMENFDIARNTLQTSLDSEGSAAAEHEKWMQSLEAYSLPKYLETNTVEYI